MINPDQPPHARPRHAPPPDPDLAPSSSAARAARACAREHRLRIPVTEQALLTVLTRWYDVCKQAELLEDGRVDLCAGGRHRITVRGNAPQSRRTWTLAHELGHLIAVRYSPVDEERWCNAFAAELLLPERWVQDHREGPQSLEALARIAQSAGQSRAATLGRLRRSAGWKAALLTFTRDDKRWVLLSTTGLEARVRQRLLSAPDTGSVLTSSTEPMGRLLPLRAGARIVVVEAECLAATEYAWVLLGTKAVNDIRRALARPATQGRPTSNLPYTG